MSYRKTSKKPSVNGPAADPETETQKPVTKYLKPKILLIDCPAESLEPLVAAGFNAVSGTFGRPYSVEMRDGLAQIATGAVLPNCSEQEIVIIDLTPPQTAAGPVGKILTSPGEEGWWCSMASGFVDPRPIAMDAVRATFDRLYLHGGIFVVFCEPRQSQNLFFGTSNSLKYYSGSHTRDRDNWCFLSVLSPDFITVRQEYGNEIRNESHGDPISKILPRYLDGADFTSIFAPEWPLEGEKDHTFFSLLKNKFNVAVGGAILHRQSKGLVLLLPQIAKKRSFILELVSEVLPEFAPRWFPDSNRFGWLNSPEYEHRAITSLKKQQENIRVQSEAAITTLDTQIEEKRKELDYLHGLLKHDGDELVKDVHKAFCEIGFMQVVDVDSVAVPGDPKQEDLQILDKSPKIIVEVKGLGGLPREDDTLQVVKYISRRMKAWDTREVIGASVVNHQKSIPPLDRSNDLAFTVQQVQDAELHDTALLTTWELFRLLRGLTEYNWPKESVKSLFYTKGRISAVPAHYKRIGKVKHFYDDLSVVSIELTHPLHAGNRVAYLFPDRFVEENPISIEVDRTSVSVANPGQCGAYKTTLSRSELKKGLPVYVVEQMS